MLAASLPDTSDTSADASRPTSAPSRRLGYFAAVWALSYLPVHVYWALGGTAAWIGVPSDAGWRAANWGASIVIAGAALTALSLVQPWGERVPGSLRRGIAGLGGSVAITHWALFSVMAVLHLTRALGYPRDAHQTAAQLRHFDWANLLYFEPWFVVMGILLIACARRQRATAPAETPLSARRRIGVVLTIGGIGVIVLGVLTFDPLVFAALGPALMGVGLVVLVSPAGASS